MYVGTSVTLLRFQIPACVCMYVCMYVDNLVMLLTFLIPANSMHTYIHVYVSAYIHTCLCEYIFSKFPQNKILKQIAYACIHVRYVCMHMWVQEQYLLSYIHAYARTNTHTYIHMHTHTREKRTEQTAKCPRVRKNVYIHACTHTHIHTHTWELTKWTTKCPPMRQNTTDQLKYNT